MRISLAFTVDTSAILKLALNENESEAFADWYYAMQDAGASFAAPDLVRYEVGNIVCRQFERGDHLRTFHALLEGVEVSPAEPQETFTLTPPLTYYDAAYVAHAASGGRRLVSFDEKMVHVARGAGVPMWDANQTWRSAEREFLPYAQANNLIGEDVWTAAGFSRAEGGSYVDVVRRLIERGARGRNFMRTVEETAHAFERYVEAANRPRRQS